MASSTVADKTISFLMVVGKLKHLKRTGWVLRKVNEPETVSGHMYRMAIMSMILPDNGSINKNRVTKMSLVHDLAEALAGDITPLCGVSSQDKYTLELQSLEKMLADIADPDIRTEFLELWKEYEDQETQEAHMVKDFDKFDMVLQAFDYETAQPHIGTSGLQEFFDSTKDKFKTSYVQDLETALLAQRNQKKREEQANEDP